MFSAPRLQWPRRWRVPIIFIAIIAALSGAYAPAAAAPQALSAQYSGLAAQYSVLGSQYLQTPQENPVPAPAAVSTGRFRYFPDTAHFLRGIFLTYWETHGALPILGVPLTEPLVENGLTVQYLERARLEWHPEISPNPAQQVLLTRLGAIMTEWRGVVFPRLPSGTNTPSSYFFPETGHNLGHGFLDYWQRNGGLAVFGYPISEEIVEVNAADGRSYTVQYFERNRFEWHPELSPPFNVQLGLLGVEYARLVGLNPLARVLLPGPVAGADQDLSDSPRLAELVEGDLLPAVQALGRTPQFRWVPAVIIEHGVEVEFADITEEGVAGAFITTRSRTRPFLILVPNSERGEAVEALASVVAHEATHAYNVTSGVFPIRSGCSIEEEVRAYMNGLAAWVLLKGSDALAQSYEPGSLEAAVNRSVRGFLDGKRQLDFDFNPQYGRQFLRGLYGSDCGRMISEDRDQ